jgi:hypothetical protein
MVLYTLRPWILPSNFYWLDLLLNPNIYGVSGLLEILREKFKEELLFDKAYNKSKELNLDSLELYEGGFQGIFEEFSTNELEEIFRNIGEIEILDPAVPQINRKILINDSNSIIYMRGNREEIYWLEKSLDPNAMDLLEANLDKINWHSLSRNPGIFTYDYEQMKKKRQPITEALAKRDMHYSEILKYLENGGDFEEMYNHFIP